MVDHEEQPILKRRRKLRLGRVLFTLFFISILLFAIYAVIQFSIGKNITKGFTYDVGEFEGDLLHPNYPTMENFLLLGIDNDGSGRSRTDTMMIVSWDKSDGSIRTLSLMRDIYAEIPGYKSYKLNTAFYLDGIQLAKDTITSMFGIPIHHYAIIDFENFESMIDIAFPNGVEMNVQKEMSQNIGVTLMPGVQQLNGQELLGYARFRMDQEGDFGRVQRQQEVIASLKNESTKLSTIIRSPKILGALSNFVETDLTEKEIIQKAIPLLLAKQMDVETMTIPVEGSYRYNDYAHAGSVIEIDLEQNRAAIDAFLLNHQ